MASVSFLLKVRDRAKDADRLCTLQLRLHHQGRVKQFSLSIQIPARDWDQRTQSVNPKSYQGKALNARLDRLKSELAIKFGLLELDRIGKFIPFEEFENVVSLHLFGRPAKIHSYIDRFIEVADRHQSRSKELYMLTLRRLRLFDPLVDKRAFEEIDRDYLLRFDQWMTEKGNSPNYRGILFRNMRTVFNDAIASELTRKNPFLRFKIPRAKTAKRSLTVEQLRALFDYPCEECQRKYVDIFRLMFFLCGINMGDLYDLKEIREGRVGYFRKKTGREYDLRVEPEAMEIIDRMRGKTALIDIADRYVNHLNYVSRVNKNLKRIGPVKVGPKGRKEFEPLFPKLSTYWARHTWATIAAELDIPDKTISLALGHAEEQKVTDIYIRRNRSKVDAANRKVIDWVLYGIRDGETVVEPGSPEFYGDMAGSMAEAMEVKN